MVLFIAGASHTGKTALAQRLLESYGYPYLSIDHLKMGLIRSGQTTLTPMDDKELTPYLWSIVKEIAKTAVENKQNLIIEGCYIPFDWRESFTEEYLSEIRAVWLIMTEEYIRENFQSIRSNACVIEQRLDDSTLNAECLIDDNADNLAGCIKNNCEYLLITDKYEAEITL